uniref:Uncharacterized protein n=1 Tax=Ananas comosus var. bracteatus TaxID=296719 RepID=A0A6V7PXA1_ANACO|nr:unnamed protein product [Ananas comosus var. bracteatus]
MNQAHSYSWKSQFLLKCQVAIAVAAVLAATIVLAEKRRRFGGIGEGIEVGIAVECVLRERYRNPVAQPRDELSGLSSARQSTGTASPEYRHWGLVSVLHRAGTGILQSIRLTKARVAHSAVGYRYSSSRTGWIGSVLTLFWSLEEFLTI